MIENKYANYTLQKLVVRNVPFRVRIEHYCQAHFFRLANNEFSSRLLQTLIENSDNFRIYTLQACKRNLSRMIEKISCVFLIVAAIRATKCEDEYHFMFSVLMPSPKRWLGKKYYKRILVSILQTCSAKTLNKAYNLLEMSTNIISFFEEKYSTYILLAIIERGHKATVKKVCSMIQNNFNQLTRSKYFLLLASKLQSHTAKEVMACLYRAASKVENADSIDNEQDKSNGYVNSYVLALASNEHNYSLQQAYWIDLHQRLTNSLSSS